MSSTHRANIVSQQLEQSEHEKIDLQRKLKAAQGGEASAALKVCSMFSFPQLST